MAYSTTLRLHSGQAQANRPGIAKVNIRPKIITSLPGIDGLIRLLAQIINADK